MAADLDKLPQTIYRWEKEGRIPPHLWCAVIEAAARREVLVTATELLAAITPKRADGWPRGKSRRKATA